MGEGGGGRDRRRGERRMGREEERELAANGVILKVLSYMDKWFPRI